MPARTAYAGAAVAGEVLTAANVNKLPGGWIGYNQVTANQLTIGLTATDLTGLSVAVTVGTSRRIRISASAAVQQRTSAALAELDIYEGATRLQRFPTSIPAELYDVLTPSVVLTPTAGSHTYKLTMLTSSGTVDMLAAADWPAFILVEDLGPAT